MINCCVFVVQRGMYLPQTYMVQEEMMVTGRVKNMRQLGPFIHRLCYGKETFRLKRRNSRRREYSYLSCLSCTQLFLICLLHFRSFSFPCPFFHCYPLPVFTNMQGPLFSFYLVAYFKGISTPPEFQ